MTGATLPRPEATSHTPGHIPAELMALGDSLQGTLAVGAPGKVGRLELGLACRDGVTRLVRHYQRSPLHIYRPIYLDPRLPGMAFIFMQQSGDGLVQGDRYCVDIECAAAATAHVTTQAATNVFVARQDFVTQVVDLRVRDQAVLEYLPDPVVPFRGSRLFQRISVTAAPSATVIVGETLLPGRVAHGEAYAYDVYWTETETRRPDGTLLFADTLRLGRAAGALPQSIALLGGDHVISTLHVVSERLAPDEVAALLREALAAHRDVLSGVSELPNACGATVRLLAPSSGSAKAAMRTAWDAARGALIGAPAPDLRKG